MKKPFLCGFLAASLLAINASAPVEAQGRVAPAPSNTFDGKLRPQQGAQYNMRFFVRTKMSQDFPDPLKGEKAPLRKSETVSLVKFNADYDIVSVDSFGNHQVRITYGDFFVDVDNKIDEKAQSSETKAAIKKGTEDYLKVMKGATFLMKLSPENKVFSIYGLDAMRAKLVKRLEGLSPEERMGAEAMLDGFLSDKNAAKNFGSMSGQLPSQPIRVSESWNYTTTAPENLPFVPSIQGIRTLVSLKDGIATLKDTAEFSMNGPVIGTPAGKEATTMDITGNQTSIMRVTNATGMPLDSTTTQTMKGTITTPYGSKGEVLTLGLSAVNDFRMVLEEK